MIFDRFKLKFNQPSSKLRYWGVAALGLALASGAAYWYQNKGNKLAQMDVLGSTNAGALGGAGGAARGGGVGVEVAKVENMPLRDDAQSVGSLRSRQNVMLRPEVAGRVSFIGFSDGTRVRRDQVLVQLDDSLQRAEMKQAQAQVALAETRYKRNQELLAQKFVSQSVLDDSDSNLKVAQAQLDLSCARLIRMRIVAPFDGTVGIRNINMGDYVKDGADLINLEDIGTLYVDFRLPERFQMRLRRGQEVELELDAFPGRQFKAQVDAIDPLIDANGRSIAVRALMANDLGQAKAPPAGMPGRPGQAPAAASGGARPSPNAAPALPGRGMGGNPGAGSTQAGQGGGRAAMGAIPAAGLPGGMPSAAEFTPPVLSAEVKECLSRAAGGAAPRTPLAASAAGGGAGGLSAAGVGPLRPGMFARVTTVFTVKAQALVVPEEALVPQAGRQFVVKAVDRASLSAKMTEALPPEVKTVSQRVEVKLGIRRPGMVEVTDGVALGDLVVVAGQQRLQKDATPLRVLELGRGGAGGSAGGGAVTPSAAPSSTPASAPTR
jgi:RND family efflux transporter MFP subunit